MVTPTSLNGAGCAAAVPAVNIKTTIKATNTFVFTDSSLLRWLQPGNKPVDGGAQRIVIYGMPGIPLHPQYEFLFCSSPGVCLGSPVCGNHYTGQRRE